MAADNLYQELKDVLQDFKDFLDQHVPTIKPAIQALASLIPQIVDLLDKLIDLMGKLKTEIQNLDVGAIPGLGEVSSFTDKVNAFLESSKNLLPDEADTIDDILSVTDVVGGLPSLDEVKTDILALIDAIVAHLNSLKPST
jgi:ABC-type transporter Mla subunit MlaD